MLAVAWRRQQEREDRRAAFGAWVLANVNRDCEKRPEPFRLEEVVSWLGHGFGRAEHQGSRLPDTPPDVEELKRRLRIVKQLHDATGS